MRFLQTLGIASKSWFPSLKKSLCAGTILLSGGIAESVSVPARADSMDTLKQQIARIQEEQIELQKALRSVQRQMTSRGNFLKNSKEIFQESGYTHNKYGHFGHDILPRFSGPALENTSLQRTQSASLAPVNTSPTNHKNLITLGPGFFGTTDVTTSVIYGRRYKRDENLTVFVAPNEVGIHPQQTAGAQEVSALGNKGIINIGPVTMILGGFINMSMTERNRHVPAGTYTLSKAIPFPNEPQYYTDNFSATARYSRLSMLVRGNLNKDSIVSGYFEMGLASGVNTTSYYKSNSFAMRLRQAYLAYDNDRLGWHILVGQAWSLLTANRIGIVARQEALPITIDMGLTAGTVWARQPQIRIVKDFYHHRLWAGFSVENPATLYDHTCYDSAGTSCPWNNTDGQLTLPNGNRVTIGHTGQGLSPNGSFFPNEIAPDIIGKLAWDPSWGHYEIKGILHFPHDRVTLYGNGGKTPLGIGHNNTAIAGGGGASMILPLIPHKMEMHLGGVVGKGIGRYGGAFLPDATVNQFGQPVPLFSAIASTGIVGHPSRTIDIYGYFSMQESGRSYWGNQVYGYGGYGSPYFNTAGCMTEGGTCQGSTHRIIEGTIGAWWRFFKGRVGTIENGVQIIYTQRKLWPGNDSEEGHKTSMSALMLDFRYLPFQG